MNKVILYHPRLWIALATGAAAFFALPGHWSTISRVLIAWNAGAALFLGLMYFWMTRLTGEQISGHFGEEDEGTAVISITVTVAAMLSLAAIVALLSTLKQVTGAERAGHMALAALTLIDSWLLVPTIFTPLYAQMYYSADAEDRPLRFPNTMMPVFWDFAYFSFTIAAACQTSDVSTTERIDSQGRHCAHTDFVSFQCRDSRLRSQRQRRFDRRKLKPHISVRWALHGDSHG